MLIKNRLCFTILLMLLSVTLSAQEKMVINGSIKDKQTGESLIRAAIKINELPSLGVLSNEYGFYAISLPSGKYTITVSQIGYEKFQQQVNLDTNLSLTIFLTPTTSLKEVVVESSKKNDNLLKPQMGTETLN